MGISGSLEKISDDRAHSDVAGMFDSMALENILIVRLGTLHRGKHERGAVRILVRNRMERLTFRYLQTSCKSRSIPHLRDLPYDPRPKLFFEELSTR